ncbi:MAG: hypothetical protein IJ097_01685 [Bacilli bacterium]|nr:hypothetical protein [Bacilli bacterium]
MSIYARYQDTDEEIEREESNYSLINILAVLAKWFIRIGIVISIILGIYFLVKLQIVNLLLFIVCLLISYFFGYFFMFCLDKLNSR